MFTKGFIHLRFTLLLCLTLGIMLSVPGQTKAQDGPPPYPAPPLEPGSLTKDETRLINQALKSIMVNWKDMDFKKDYVKDPFRLSAVQRALDNPPSLIEWNYMWDAFLLDSKPAGEILRKAAIDLDCKTNVQLPTSSRIAAAQSLSNPGIPDSWIEPVMDLDQAIENASFRMSSVVLQSLSEDDREFLPFYLICRFAEDDPPEGCPEEEDYGASPQFLDIMQKFDRSSLMMTSSELSDAVYAALGKFAKASGKITLDKPVSLKGISGTILIGTTGNDNWDLSTFDKPTLILDPGGDDVYRGSVAAGGNLQGDNFPLVSVVIDLSGNDMYLAEDSRSNGSGVLGIGMQFDLNGNDTYRAYKMSQGCGLFGVGLLEDRQGDDLYKADMLVQGAGAIGAGLLNDLDGRDSYNSAFYAQGFGYTLGWGMLTDRNGYDNYYAGGKYDAWPTWGPYILSCSQGYAFGIRPVASGGIGIIHDRNGNDYYSAEVFSQGGSYWYGIGSMIDDNGNDQYIAQVYSQGAGVHLSTGIITDRAGNDNYSCDNQSQGFAHDFSVGWLIDEGGNDNYSAKSAGQGCAVTNSVAGLIDRAGDDGYICRDPAKGSGYGGTTRGFGNIGLQIDMQGKDTYSYDFAYDGAWWNVQSWYAGIDVGEDWWKIEKGADGKEISRTLIIPGVDSNEK